MKKVNFAFIFLALLLLAACGGDENAEGTGSEESSSSRVVEVTATNWQFNKENYTVPAGEVTFNFTNKEGAHGLKIDGTDVDVLGDGSATVTLEPGEYTIRCNAPCGPGHADMQSTLTVE